MEKGEERHHRHPNFLAKASEISVGCREPNQNAGSPERPAILLHPSDSGSVFRSARCNYWRAGEPCFGETFAAITLWGTLLSSRVRARGLRKPGFMLEVTSLRRPDRNAAGSLCCSRLLEGGPWGWKAETEGLTSCSSGRARRVRGSFSLQQAFSVFLLISISNCQLVNSSLEILKFT